MQLKVGEDYLTKCGNTVTCFRESDEGFWCRYTKVIENHESLIDMECLTNQLWAENGLLVNYPGGIHDIVKTL